MSLNTWISLLCMPDLGAQLGIARDAQAFVRLHFLHAASRAGILKRLISWTTRDELARETGARERGVLDALLEVGVTLGELARDRDSYRIAGKRSSALVGEGGDALAALIEEYVMYHAEVYRDCSKRLADGQPGDYLIGKGELIARSSRMLEPFMVEFVQRNVAGKGAMRLLEIGCGSGIYLRHAAAANSALTGVGIDLQEDVVRQTTARLVAWELDSRFQIHRADVRVPAPELAGPFDLVTLYNNIYYFPTGDRAALLRSLHERLRSGGALALTSMFQGGTVAAANFDLVLRSTAGCAAMGTVEQLAAHLREGGFGRVTTTRLVPGEPLYGVTAQKQ